MRPYRFGTTYTRTRGRAFTLIELLIVAGILPIVTLALMGVVGGLHRMHEALAFRIDAAESSEAAAAAWTDDVELARAIAVSPDARTMTLTRPDPQNPAAPLEVVYILRDGRGLVRAARGRMDRVIVPLAREVRFEPVAGDGYRMRVACAESTGLSTLHWNAAACATPLVPIEGGERQP